MFLPFQGIIFRFHVSFLGCISTKNTTIETTNEHIFYQLHLDPVIFWSIIKKMPPSRRVVQTSPLLGRRTGGRVDRLGWRWVGSGCWVAWHLALKQQKMAAIGLHLKKHREIPNGISIIYQIFGFTAGFDAWKNFVWRMEMPGMERFFTIFATKTNPMEKIQVFWEPKNIKNEVNYGIYH